MFKILFHGYRLLKSVEAWFWGKHLEGLSNQAQVPFNYEQLSLKLPFNEEHLTHFFVFFIIREMLLMHGYIATKLLCYFLRLQPQQNCIFLSLKLLSNKTCYPENFHFFAHAPSISPPKSPQRPTTKQWGLSPTIST